MPKTKRIEIRTMPADLLARIDRAAAADHRSRSGWIVRTCERALEGRTMTTEMDVVRARDMILADQASGRLDTIEVSLDGTTYRVNGGAWMPMSAPVTLILVDIWPEAIPVGTPIPISPLVTERICLASAAKH
jgi:uncharacterized protein (DUF1778 family)